MGSARSPRVIVTVGVPTPKKKKASARREQRRRAAAGRTGGRLARDRVHGRRGR